MQKTIRINILRGAFYLLVFAFVVGCKSEHDKMGHDLTVQLGERNNKLVQQFNALTPRDDRWHWISYFDGYGGTPTWNSFAKLHGRYKIKMQFRITLNRRSREFEHAEEPRFYIDEVTVVEIPKTENAGIGCKFGQQFSFGIDDWKTLVKNGGDFSTIGIELKENSPVDNFEKVKQ